MAHLHSKPPAPRSSQNSEAQSSCQEIAWPAQKAKYSPSREKDIKAIAKRLKVCVGRPLIAIGISNVGISIDKECAAKATNAAAFFCTGFGRIYSGLYLYKSFENGKWTKKIVPVAIGSTNPTPCRQNKFLTLHDLGRRDAVSS